MSAPFSMARLKSHLLLDQPFFGTLAYHLEDIADPSIETLATNGVVLKYNPAYLGTLTPAEQKFVLAHEVLHPALLHPYRRYGRDLEEWNKACDYVINGELVASGFTPPAGVLMDPQFDGMSAEQVYSARRAQSHQPQDDKPQQPDQDGKDESGEGDSAGGDSQEDGKTGEGTSDGKGQGPGELMAGCPTGHFVDGPETAESVDDKTAADWEVIAAEAALVASRAGELPGGVARALAQTREPNVDWVAETREFISYSVKSGKSWTRPNRRLVSKGLYLPGPLKRNVGPLVVALDSSASTWPLLEVFGAEVSGLLRDARPEKLIVIYCDTRVNAVEEFTPEDGEVKLTIKGGGGTRFQPVFDYIEAEGIDPLAVLYLTDLDGPAPQEPPYPVLWVAPIHSPYPAPFGRLVRMP